MKRIIITLGMAVGCCICHAQVVPNGQSLQDWFRKEAEEMRKDYEDFRSKCNEEYADFVRQAWKEFRATPAVPVPEEKPVPPVVIPKPIGITPIDTLPLDTKPIVIDEVIRPIEITPQPEPVEPIREVPVIDKSGLEFTFFGTKAKVRVERNGLPKLRSVDENAVADALKAFADRKYDNVIYDCLALRRELKLCDWAYIQMLKNMGEMVCGKGTNEAVLLMAYVYMQSGYKMRLASADGKLYMLFASKHQIYDSVSYGVDGNVYYGVDKLPSRLNICQAKFQGEQPLSLLVTEAPQLAQNDTKVATHTSVRNADMKVEMKANQNMLDFYTSYPTSMIGSNFVTRWAMYANMPMPEHVKQQVYPQLRSALNGCNQLVAVNKILNWIQTGFVYEYDDKVWGDDRAFFPEESLHYPYCDCEDRSILLTRIVRDLLGLRCILIYYPGHLASAVEITEGSPSGDYIDCQGHRFFIADGTITGWGAPVGMTMKGMDNKTAKVIMLE